MHTYCPAPPYALVQSFLRKTAQIISKPASGQCQTLRSLILGNDGNTLIFTSAHEATANVINPKIVVIFPFKGIASFCTRSDRHQNLTARAVSSGHGPFDRPN